MPDIDTLMEKHGEDTVRKAFWLQEHIFENGIDPVHFSRAAEADIREAGPLLVKRQIDAELAKKDL